MTFFYQEVGEKNVENGNSESRKKKQQHELILM